MTRIRMIDVANKANVSKSTVSQYLNGRFGHMSQQTKEKIRAAVEELNYVPNHLARSLKSDKTRTIGVVVRDISGFNTGRILRGIDDFCKQHHYNVMIYNTDFDQDVERDSLITLKNLCVDGIIMTSTGKNADLINEYTSKGFPIVQFQLEYDSCPTHMVLSDYRQAAQQATEYLIGLGHQRIGFLTQRFEESLSRQQRYQGYLDALAKHHIEFDENLVQYWERDNGFKISPIEMLRNDNSPTAFFTQHLAITTDLLKQCTEHNIDIPNQVSIVGFDEIPMVEMFKVPVTVVQQDPYNIGLQSAKLLLNILNKEVNVESHQKVIVPCSFVERASCSRVKI